jgi:hypothetical protein
LPKRQELTRIVASRDLSGASRVAADLLEAADDLSAESLMSLVYALYIGDPDGTTLLAGDISRRHDFGFGARFGPNRLRAPWAMPSPDVSAGIPWHVDGAVLGLDAGLATLQLRRLSTDHVVDAPTLTYDSGDVPDESVAERCGARRDLPCAERAAQVTSCAPPTSIGWQPAGMGLAARSQRGRDEPIASSRCSRRRFSSPAIPTRHRSRFVGWSPRSAGCGAR